MKADTLYQFLQETNKYHDLSKVEISFRMHYDDDVIPVNYVDEGLMAEDNVTLNEIMFSNEISGLREFPLSLYAKPKGDYPFKEGDEYWIIVDERDTEYEYGFTPIANSVIGSIWDWESEEMHRSNPSRTYYYSEEEALKDSKLKFNTIR